MGVGGASHPAMVGVWAFILSQIGNCWRTGAEGCDRLRLGESFWLVRNSVGTAVVAISVGGDGDLGPGCSDGAHEKPLHGFWLYFEVHPVGFADR